MKKLTSFLLFAIFVFVGFGCTPQPEPKTVEYYLKNEAERVKVSEACDNNPGKLKDDPDCINARQALQKRQATKPVKAVPY